MSEFKNKIALITGGTRGIGRAISLNLARSGAKVLALYGRDRAAADRLSSEAQSQNLDIICLRGDLTHPEKSQTLIDEIEKLAPQIHYVIHSAASGVHRNALELSLKHMNWTFDINVFAIHNLLQKLISRIPQGGRIIGISSAGATRVIPYYAAVGSSKGALESLFRHYAFELAPKGISVNCVCPGLVLTDAVEAFPDKENRADRALASTPSGKLTTPEDVAQLVKFLCSAQAGQIVGQTLVIDGGKTLLS